MFYLPIENTQICVSMPAEVSVYEVVEQNSGYSYIYCAEETRN